MTSYFRLSAYIERNDLRVRLKVELNLRQGYHECMFQRRSYANLGLDRGGIGIISASSE